jgi:hypothetical protein
MCPVTASPSETTIARRFGELDHDRLFRVPRAGLRVTWWGFGSERNQHGRFRHHDLRTKEALAQGLPTESDLSR